MDLRVCIQDPTHPGTTYLYEAILGAASKASDWRGLYAFATRDGVDQLIEDKVVHDLIERGGEVDLVVGVDAVTNRATLERMQEFEQKYRGFRPKVFWNTHRGLFHPKISDFRLKGGGRMVIVGSGNLTPGGLMGNFEAYTVITAEQGDGVDFGAVEEFMERHGDGIRSIDEEVLERAARNIVRPIVATRRLGARRGRVVRDTVGSHPAPGFERVLVAQVPRAGSRWAQVHFNAEVIGDYFRLRRFEIERVYLTHVLEDARRGEIEVRRCVFSAESNRNHKIEIGAAGDLPYPQDGRPLLVFRERRLRTYDYMLLMPGERGYGPLLDLSNRLPSPGKGLPRPVTDLVELGRAWSDCPLLYTPEAGEPSL